MMSLKFRGRSSESRPQQRPRPALRVEALEDRVTPATFTLVSENIEGQVSTAGFDSRAGLPPSPFDITVPMYRGADVTNGYDWRSGIQVFYAPPPRPYTIADARSRSGSLNYQNIVSLLSFGSPPGPNPVSRTAQSK